MPINTSSYSSLTKSFLMESNLYNFSSSYNLTFLLSFNLHIFHTSYIIHIINIISHKIFISLPSPLFSKNAKYSYKSPSHGRHELLLLKSFSQKAPRSYIKALLLQGTTISYKSPSLRSHNYFLHKALLLEDTYTSYKNPSHGRQLYS